MVSVETQSRLWECCFLMGPPWNKTRSDAICLTDYQLAACHQRRQLSHRRVLTRHTSDKPTEIHTRVTDNLQHWTLSKPQTCNHKMVHMHVGESMSCINMQMSVNFAVQKEISYAHSFFGSGFLMHFLHARIITVVAFGHKSPSSLITRWICSFIWAFSAVCRKSLPRHHLSIKHSGRFCDVMYLRVCVYKASAGGGLFFCVLIHNVYFC